MSLLFDATCRTLSQQQEIAKLRADNKALLDVVKDYREAEDHAFCDPAGTCGMDGKPTRDVRCPICKKADELIEHSEPQ